VYGYDSTYIIQNFYGRRLYANPDINLGVTEFNDDRVFIDQYWLVNVTGDYANITSYVTGFGLSGSWSSVYTTDSNSPFVFMSNQTEMYFDLNSYNLVNQSTVLLTDFTEYLDHSFCSDNYTTNVDLNVNISNNASYYGGNGVYQPLAYRAFNSKLPVLNSTSFLMNLSDYQTNLWFGNESHNNWTQFLNGSFPIYFPCSYPSLLVIPAATLSTFEVNFTATLTIPYGYETDFIYGDNWGTYVGTSVDSLTYAIYTVDGDHLVQLNQQ
jgi:hypothetical protein